MVDKFDRILGPDGKKIESNSGNVSKGEMELLSKYGNVEELLELTMEPDSGEEIKIRTITSQDFKDLVDLVIDYFGIDFGADGEDRGVVGKELITLAKEIKQAIKDSE